MSDGPALSSETRSLRVVHLELGLLKGPKIARPLKGELRERTLRDPSRSSPSRPSCHQKCSTANPRVLFSFCAASTFLAWPPFLQRVVKTLLGGSPCHPFSAEISALWPGFGATRLCVVRKRGDLSGSRAAGYDLARWKRILLAPPDLGL